MVTRYDVISSTRSSHRKCSNMYQNGNSVASRDISRHFSPGYHFKMLIKYSLGTSNQYQCQIAMIEIEIENAKIIASSLWSLVGAFENDGA